MFLCAAHDAGEENHAKTQAKSRSLQAGMGCFLSGSAFGRGLLSGRAMRARIRYPPWFFSGCHAFPGFGAKPSAATAQPLPLADAARPTHTFRQEMLHER